MRYQKPGLREFNEEQSTLGFTLIAPVHGFTVYLINMLGEVVHEWKLPEKLGSLAYLLPGGHLLTSVLTSEGPPIIEGKGGHIQEFDWEGNLVWEHIDHAQHHDFRRLANNNTMYLGWDEMTNKEALRVKGGIPGTERNGKIYSDFIKEITPDGKVQWEWHARDLIIEDYPMATDCHRFEFAHANACAPAPGGNYLINFRHLDMMAVIDKGTKKFLWQHRERNWGHQHNAEFLKNGNITFFSNGMNNDVLPPRSRAIEINPKTGETVWEYQAPQSWTFFSPIVSSVQRLNTGNTIICEGLTGRVFEVTQNGKLVWEYISPYFNDVFPNDGPSNILFRAYRYTLNSIEIRNHLD